jgi:hypothetical protein
MNDIKCINYDRPTDKVLKFTLLKIDEVQSCRLNTIGDHHGRDCMVVGFITTYAISTYHHSCCEFKSHLRERCTQIQHYVIKFVSDSWQVGGFLCVL